MEKDVEAMNEEEGYPLCAGSKVLPFKSLFMNTVHILLNVQLL